MSIEIERSELGVIINYTAGVPVPELSKDALDDAAQDVRMREFMQESMRRRCDLLVNFGFLCVCAPRLAADKLLLQSRMRQNAIQVRRSGFTYHLATSIRIYIYKGMGVLVVWAWASWMVLGVCHEISLVC